MPKLIFTESYNKKAGVFLRKHPELKNQYAKTLSLLQINPKHPSLRLHKLKGVLQNLYAISINASYRLTLNFIIKDDLIIPIDLGTHDEVYKN